MKKSLFFILLISAASQADNIDLQTNPAGLWMIAHTNTHKRWIEIHNLAEARTSGIYHIEVIARKKGAPVWQIEHLQKHMAISSEALAKSVIAPLNRGAVYPESFNDAYHQWQQQTNGKVCTTTITECLE